MRLNTGSSEASEFQLSGKHALLAVLVVGVVVAGWYVWGKLSVFTGGIPATPTEKAAQNRPRRPSPKERQKRMVEMYTQAGVTPEQIQQIEALPRPTDRDGRRKHRQEINKILTEEQRNKIRENMRARWEERLKGLSPAERAEIEKRFGKQRKRWEARRRDGGDGPGGPRKPREDK